jgi:hypothetical protein
MMPKGTPEEIARDFAQHLLYRSDMNNLCYGEMGNIHTRVILFLLDFWRYMKENAVEDVSILAHDISFDPKTAGEKNSLCQ